MYECIITYLVRKTATELFYQYGNISLVMDTKAVWRQDTT